jgi:hypothetical protein
MATPRLILLLSVALVATMAPCIDAQAAGSAVARIDFGPAGAAVPSGYVLDSGAAFDAGRGSGWLEQSGSAPLSLVGNGRERDKVADQRLDTLMHMQLSGSGSGVKTPGRWEYALAAGTYDVTVAVGDPSYTDSVHRLSVEGTLAVNNFTPSASNLFKTATVRVTVNDGRLTLDAAGGTNTKIDYVDIYPTGAPAVSISLSGPGGPDTYSGPVTVTVNSPDGSTTQEYAIDGGAYQAYTAPFTVSATGDHKVDARAVTSSGTTTATRRFAIDAPPPSGGTIVWRTGTSAPQPRSEAQGVAVNGKLYVFGGYTDSTYYPSNRADAYNPATNAWSSLAPMPRGLTHSGTAAEGGHIYMAGGYGGRPGGGQIFAIQDVYRYDVDTNSWSTLTSLPVARGSGALVVLGRTLHFFGGADINRADRGEHWTLDLDHPTAWTAAVTLPNPRTHMGYAAFGGRVYAIGGQHDVDSNLVTQATVHVWDPASPNSWSQLPNLPSARSHISNAVFELGGQLVAAGGETSNGNGISSVTAYDPVTNSWRSLTPLPATRYSGIAGLVGSVIVYTTGSHSASTYNGQPS